MDLMMENMVDQNLMMDHHVHHLEKLQFYGYTMVYPKWKDASSPWKRRHITVNSAPCSLSAPKTLLPGKNGTHLSGFFIKTGTWGMCLQFLVGKLFRSSDGNWGDFDKHKCWANQKLWFWQAKSRPFSNQKCGCLPTRITEGVQPSESIRMARSAPISSE